MNKTRENNLRLDERLTMSANTLAKILDCGRATALRIGSDCGAKVQVGNRILYRVDRVKEYINSIENKQ